VEIVLFIVAVLVVVTVAWGMRKPSPRLRRRDEITRRREERNLL
jgi:hypothetical protein